MRIWELPDGTRRFLPSQEDGVDGYATRAFQYGHAFLAYERNWPHAECVRWLVGKHAFDWSRSTQDCLSVEFGSPGSLVLRRGAAQALGRTTLLPQGIGSAEKPWDLPEFTERATALAGERGINNPSGQELISHGLHAAALLNPLTLSDAGEIASLVRTALFDASKAPPQLPSDFGDAILADIEQRFTERIYRHLDEPREQFLKWFGGAGNLLKSLTHFAGREPLERDVVRRGLLDLAWRGMLQTAECFETFARRYARALPKVLSPNEQKYYEAMYYRRPYLGGLSLVLLLDRATILKPIIAELWEAPDDPLLIGALHRVLAYYSEMAVSSREHERGKKAHTAARRTVELPENDALADVGEHQVLHDVLENILKKRQISCPKCGRPAFPGVADEVFLAGKPIRLEVNCMEHSTVGELVIPWDEVAEAVMARTITKVS